MRRARPFQQYGVMPDFSLREPHLSPQIKTFNDKPNQAMLRMNEGLGFQRTRTIYPYELRLGGE